MSVQLLTSMISVFCFQSSISRDTKELCMERVVNCAIVYNGGVRKDFEICFNERFKYE